MMGDAGSLRSTVNSRQPKAEEQGAESDINTEVAEVGDTEVAEKAGQGFGMGMGNGHWGIRRSALWQDSGQAAAASIGENEIAKVVG